VKVHHLSEHLPIVVEIVDQPDRIAAFLPKLDTLVAEGIVTIEKVRTIIYRRDEGPDLQFEDEIPLESPVEVADSPLAAAVIERPVNDAARKILDAAHQSAGKSRRVVADSVDVLLAMLCESNGIANRALTTLGIDCETVSRNLRESVSRDESFGNFTRALEKKARADARWLDHEDIGTAHLLLALCEIRPSAATDTLMRLGAQPRDICNEVLKLLGHEDDWQGWLADHPEM
jgi:hypothetical protein